MNRATTPQAARSGVPAAGVAQQPTPNPVGPQNGAQALTVLALDLATLTGWAIIQLGTSSIIASGALNLVPKSPLPTKFALLAELINGSHKTHNVQAVITEAPNPFITRSMENARLALGLNTHAEYLTHKLGLDFLQPLSTSTLKKHAATLIGEPKATKGKAQAIQAATGLLGRAPVDSNEADAVVLAHWASLNAEEIRP